jgi:hypothetical protein
MQFKYQNNELNINVRSLYVLLYEISIDLDQTNRIHSKYIYSSYLITKPILLPTTTLDMISCQTMCGNTLELLLIAIIRGQLEVIPFNRFIMESVKQSVCYIPYSYCRY